MKITATTLGYSKGLDSPYFMFFFFWKLAFLFYALHILFVVSSHLWLSNAATFPFCYWEINPLRVHDLILRLPSVLSLMLPCVPPFCIWFFFFRETWIWDLTVSKLHPFDLNMPKLQGFFFLNVALSFSYHWPFF